MNPVEWKRRTLLQTTAAAAFGAVFGEFGPSEALAQANSAVPVPELLLRVNGADHRVTLDARMTLLDALRGKLGLTGTKKGCDRGECGACTIHIDGRRVLSCMTLAVMAEGKAITTIEGLAPRGELHPVQSAFIEHDAFQCGYCTSGQIMSAVACIREGHAGSNPEIREFMSGNICRCAAYPQIVAAVRASALKEGI